MEKSEQMSRIKDGNAPTLRLSFEVVLALYSSFLLALAHEARSPYAWTHPAVTSTFGILMQ
jgi:hypothetical protein